LKVDQIHLIIRYLTTIYTSLLLLSCNQNKKENRDHEVFRYNQFENVSSLDPAFARDVANIWSTNQLFNGLVL